MSVDLLGVKNDPSLLSSEKVRIHGNSDLPYHYRKLAYFRGDSWTERCAGVSFGQSSDRSKPTGSGESLRAVAVPCVAH